MRIGLYHGPLRRTPDGYESYGPYVRYVEAFARQAREVVVFAPVTTRETDYRGCRIEADNVRVVALPDFSTHIQAVRHLPTLYRIFRREIGSVDVVNCRNTAPFGHLLYRLGRARGVGFFYHFTSDPWEILRVGPKYGGFFGRFARLAYRMDFAFQKRVMRRTYSFVNGKPPCDRLRGITDRVEPVTSSTLTAGDVVRREDFALHTPPRLLYVGYLKHMKGLTYLIDALAALEKRGKEAELRIVGAGPEERALRAQVDRLGMTDRVHFQGYIPMGSKLNQQYDEADLFVFPSLSEGSPRVVLEALARGLPIITTAVGGVPDLVKHEESALIVPARSAEVLADAVARMTGDAALRARCGQAGFEAVRGHLVDDYVRPLIEKARQLARGKEDRA